MKKIFWVGVLAILFVSSIAIWRARSEVRDATSAGEGNFEYGEPDYSELRLLWERENLNYVVAAGEKDADRSVLLREWARAQWDTPARGSMPEPAWNARRILDRIRSGDLPGGACSEYAVVLLQASLAAGIPARIVSLESREGSGHRVVEVWAKENRRWMVMDPFFDVAYEREGVLLNAWDLHRALESGETEGIRVRRGARDRGLSPQALLAYYHHFTILFRSNASSDGAQEINLRSEGYVDTFTDGRPSFSKWLTRDGEALYLPPPPLRREYLPSG